MKRTSTKTNAKTSIDHTSRPLDLTTVKTTRDVTPRTRRRIFGLTEAPTYHPTKEEFKDPLKYINKIQHEAEQYGIIKIVPPKDYKPEFCLNTEVFRFRTRIQKLNSMEGQTRTSLNYWDQLQNYHRSQSKPIYRLPQLDKRPIDLYKLKKVVMQKGGYQKVSNENNWTDVGKGMGYTSQGCPSMASSLRKAYTRLILPYEIWLAKHKDKSVSSQDDTDDDKASDESVSSDETDQACEICHKDDNAAELLLCDDCDRGYHMRCLTPPLTSVPAAEWYCIKCLTDAGKDYGFEEGGEYSLSGFQKFCNKFKTNWFSEDTPVKSPLAISEEDCEDEFWRLVDDPHETCEVEYGADLHSTQHGSASASIERGPNGIKGNDPWNPYILPILPDSLFTHIKTDISGMMVPWLYIGMCFSAFCWHNEDHFTYSVNYMHWGETKTWYGVPGEDTAKFEDTMKKAVPELFEQQPNLLFQLVTMLSPGRLLKEKVRVYAVDQRPGEFVVTFPKAYHSGFNHGFNFCEAVNFAPIDWLPLGLECAKRYKEYRRQPCFSHDELMVNVAKLDLTSENAAAIRDGLLEMQQRELDERRQLKLQHPTINQRLLSDNIGSSSMRQHDDQQHQCLFCRCYTFLSYVTCACSKKIACLDHVNELCGCSDSKKKIILRFTDDEIQQLVDIASQAAKKISDWDMLARKLLSGNTMPSTNTLKQLLMEADKKGISMTETMNLRAHLDRIQQWEGQVSHLLYTMNQKPKRFSIRLEANHSGDGNNNDTFNGERHSLLHDLLQQCDTMAFDSPYITQLKTLVGKLDSFQQQAKRMVHRQNPMTKDLQAMLDYGYSLNADIEEMDWLKTTLLQYHWINKLEPEAMQPPLDLDKVTVLAKQARQFKLPEENRKLKNVVAKLHQGNNWVKRARHLLIPDNSGKLMLTMEDLDDLLNVDQDVPTLREMYQELQSLRSKLYTSTSIFNRTMMQCLLPELLDRPTANDIYELQAQAINIPLSAIHNESKFFDHEMERTDKWTIRAKSLLVTTKHGHSKSRSLEMLISDLYDEADHILALHWKRKTATPQKYTSGRRRHETYCICQKPEAGFMIKCDTCADWYHGSCVKELRKNFNVNSSYTCPVCDPSNDIFSLVRRPKIDDFYDLMDGANDLKVVPESYLALQKIQHLINPYRDEVVAFCRSKPVLDVNDIGKIKLYLKQLLGLPIALEDETDFLRKKVYDITKQQQQQQQHEQQHEQQQEQPEQQQEQQQLHHQMPLHHNYQESHQQQQQISHHHWHQQLHQQQQHHTSTDNGRHNSENQYRIEYLLNKDPVDVYQYPSGPSPIYQYPSGPSPIPAYLPSSSSSSSSTATTSRPVIKLILNPPAPPRPHENSHNTPNHHSQLDKKKRKSGMVKDQTVVRKKRLYADSFDHQRNTSSNNNNNSNSNKSRSNNHSAPPKKPPACLT